MSTVPRTSRSRLLAASAALGVVAVMGGVPAAAHADGTDPATQPDQAAAAETVVADPTPGARDDAGVGSQADDGDDADADAADADDADTGDAGDTTGPADTPSDTTDEPSGQPTGATADPDGDGGATTSDGPVETTPAPGTETPSTVTDETAVTAQEDPTPNYGLRKVRVGVKLQDGSYVPPGSSTAGTTLQVSASLGPSTCVTGPADASGASYCSEQYTSVLDSSTTVTQASANADLVVKQPTATVGPCLDPGPPVAESTADADAPPETCSATPTDLTTVDAGTPPVAVADSDAARTSGASVDIDVLANDDNGNGAPVTGTTISSAPSHGSATFVGGGGGSGRAAIGGGPVVRYTPQAGFGGTDTFRYTFTTANGSATGTVTVTVPAAPVSSPPTTSVGGTGGTVPAPTAVRPRVAPRVAPAASAPATTSSGALPSTGGPDGRLLGLGAVLLGAGGVVTVASRRRTAR